MTDRWYRPTLEPMIPPLRAKVRVFWEEHTFIAWRDVHPKTRARCWAVVMKDGEIAYWPPRHGWPRGPRWFKGARAYRFSPEPALFQPLDLSQPIWRTVPMPGPVAPTFGPKFSAGCSPREPVDEIDARDDWWRDPSALTYSAPPYIGRAEAEGRIMRAILTDGLMPWKSRATLAGWPKALIEAAAKRAEQSTNAYRPPFKPTPRDVSDNITAMRWFAMLDPPELRRTAIRDEYTDHQLALILRAQDPAYTWREVGLALGLSHEGARKFYAKTIEMIERGANGKQVFDDLPQRDRLAETRERNRRAKRGEFVY